MKPTWSNILDANPGPKGFIVDDGVFAAIPYGNQLMVIHNGEQVKLCRNAETARKHIKKLQKVNVSNLQRSVIM